ncbi:hypothetical protein TNCV_287931 [Trichonephila clavipes]|nr:hypothetical protein TNCV_287931 [Trichonephila clavipes]
MSTISDFRRGQIVGTRLAGASVIETSQHLGASKGTVFSHDSNGTARDHCHINSPEIPQENDCFSKAVILVHSQAAIQAVVMKHDTDTKIISEIRQTLNFLYEYKKTDLVK